MNTVFLAFLCGVFLIAAAVYIYSAVGGLDPDKLEEEGQLTGFSFYTFVNPDTNDVRFRVPVDYSADLEAERAHDSELEHIDEDSAIEETVNGVKWYLAGDEEYLRRLTHPKRKEIFTSLVQDGLYLTFDGEDLLFWSDSRNYQTGQGIDHEKLQATVRKLIIFGELFKEEPDPERIAPLT